MCSMLSKLAYIWLPISIQVKLTYTNIVLICCKSAKIITLKTAREKSENTKITTRL